MSASRVRHNAPSSAFNRSASREPTACTSYPSAWRCGPVCLPINPVPPVTRTRFIAGNPGRLRPSPTGSDRRQANRCRTRGRSIGHRLPAPDRRIRPCGSTDRCYLRAVWNPCAMPAGMYSARPFSATAPPQPTAVGRRIRPKIDHHVVHCALGAADELHLGPGFVLEVQASQCAALTVRGQVALHESRQQTMSGELVFAEGTREESALVFPPLQVEHPHARDRGLGEVHASTSSDGIATTKRPPHSRNSAFCM